MKTQIRNPWTGAKLLLLAGASALIPTFAQAHPMHGETGGFASGFIHPIHGWDHILAMVAVGLWAAQLGGRALWLVPAAFVSLMTVGGAMGMAGAPLPGVEAGILASVLALGLLIAAGARLPLGASLALVGFFAIFHGHAHGTELPAAASGFSYGVGFVLATVGLHACGMALGLLAQKRFPVPAIRFAGGAIALAGLCLCLA
jgi:urease accessory protein